MRLTAWWRSLDPRWQRWLMIGGVMMVLIAGVYPFLSQDNPPQRGRRDETIKQILTDKDPRALGFDGLMAELKTLRAQFETTRRDLEQLQTGQPTSLQENLRRQQGELRGTGQNTAGAGSATQRTAAATNAGAGDADLDRSLGGRRRESARSRRCVYRNRTPSLADRPAGDDRNNCLAAAPGGTAGVHGRRRAR